MVIKRCSCGREYALDEFRNLLFTGVYLLPDDGQKPERLEQRRCYCGSDIVIPIDRDGNYFPEGENDE